MMKVKELIEKLQKCDPEAIVEISTTCETAEVYDINAFEYEGRKYVRIEST